MSRCLNVGADINLGLGLTFVQVECGFMFRLG